MIHTRNIYRSNLWDEFQEMQIKHGKMYKANITISIMSNACACFVAGTNTILTFDSD